MCLRTVVLCVLIATASATCLCTAVLSSCTCCVGFPARFDQTMCIDVLWDAEASELAVNATVSGKKYRNDHALTGRFSMEKPTLCQTLSGGLASATTCVTIDDFAVNFSRRTAHGCPRVAVTVWGMALVDKAFECLTFGREERDEN